MQQNATQPLDLTDQPSAKVLRVIDTTYYSDGFPDMNWPKLIPRSNYLSQIEDAIQSNSIVFIEGDEDAGKTTLLGQFCKKHLASTISVFFNPQHNLGYELDYYCTNVVQQMNYLMKEDMGGDYNFISTQQYRQSLYQFKKFTKRNRHKTNLVIDGLEDKIKEEPDFVSKLLSNLPIGEDKFVIILTGNKNHFLNLYPKLKKEESTTISLFGFSDPEAVSFLNLGEQHEFDIKDLYKVTKGYPGRLLTLKRLIVKDGYALSDISSSTTYSNWIELDCESVQINSAEENLLFSLLALTDRTYSLAEISAIGNLEISIVNDIVCKSPILNKSEKNVAIISSAHKRYLANLLRGKRSKVDDMLIDYYANNDTLSSLIDLPKLYAEKKEWEKVIQLVNENYFTKILERTGSLKLVTQTLELGVLASEKASKSSDMLRYSIQGSILKELDDYHFWESELEARISIDDYAGAIALAESAAVLVDRLNLLALVARRQKEFTNSVDEVLINLIQELYRTIDLADAGEKIYDIVAHLFYAIPNLAIEMIEKSSGAVAEGNINEWVAAKLSIAAIESSLKSQKDNESSKSMEVVQNINNPAVKKINSAISFLVGNYTSAKVLDEVQKISDPYEKLKLLRLWLNNNKTNIDGVEDVISTALTELIYSSSETSITLEVLAELSKQLPHIKDAIARKKLYERFKSIENDLTDLGLTRDKYLYKLNIFHVEFFIDERLAIQTINKILVEIDNQTDMLVKLEGFAEAYGKLFKTNKAIFQDKVRFIYSRILSLSAELYKSTAIQLKISENFLETIGSVNPQLALKIIKEINNVDRREQARFLVLSAYLKNNLKYVSIDVLSEIERSFERQISKDGFCLEVLERFSNARNLHFKIILQLLKFQDNANNLTKVSNKIQAYIYLYKIATKNEEWKTKKGAKIENTLYQAWRALDADWEKIDYGFKICYEVAKENFTFAKKLFDESEELKTESWTDSKLVAYTYLNSLKLIIRSYSGLMLSKTDTSDDFKLLNDLISKVPSELSKLKSWTEIGFYAISVQRDDIFKRVVNDHVILIVHDLISKKINIERASDAITLIHLHDSGVATNYLKKINEELRERMLSDICYYYVTKRNPFEAYNQSIINFSSNFTDLTKAVSVLAEVKDDNDIYFLVDHLCNAIQSAKTLAPPQVSTLISDLTKIIEEKLPDARNIQHEGYKILADQKIAKINRHAAINNEYWTSIAKRADDIPNLSDKIFVKAVLLDEFPFDKITNNSVVKRVLYDSIAEGLNALPVHYEFVQRVIDISEIMYRFDKTNWKKFVERAFSLSATLNDGADIYSSQRSIIDSMHRIDPTYSKELIKQIDKENTPEKINKLLLKHYEALEVAEKIKKSKTLEQKEKENTRVIVKSVYSALKSLNTENIAPKKISEMLIYLPIGNKLPLHEVFPVFLYYLNNCARTYNSVTDGTAINHHRENFRECVNAANIVQIFSQKRKRNERPVRKNFIDEEFSTTGAFRPKTRETAFNFIKNWLFEQTEEFIIVADPGFVVEDLEILKLIKESTKNLRVDILGSKVSLDNETENTFKQYAKTLSDENNLFVKFNFCYFEDGIEQPFEGRWLITRNGGLRIGTNISLLGSKKEGDIVVLKPNEALKICEDTLIEYVSSRRGMFKNQRVNYKGFGFWL